ncbi:hypothetical protein SSU98_0853 [Streptococcus suis 98HAH33]|nr:hypothetical protein SSU98_0853 [Streptococcus suis 98HAH33]
MAGNIQFIEGNFIRDDLFQVIGGNLTGGQGVIG